MALSSRSVFLIGWSGMRGVLALAAALSLPEQLSSGAAFPQRNMILFLTFCVIFTTLVLQGLSMPLLIRRLGLSGVSPSREEERGARVEMASAALKSLQTAQESHDAGQTDPDGRMYDYYRRRLALLESGGQEESVLATRNAKQIRLIAQTLRNVERSVVLRLRAENKIHDEVARALEYELDLQDARDAVLNEFG